MDLHSFLPSIHHFGLLNAQLQAPDAPKALVISPSPGPSTTLARVTFQGDGRGPQLPLLLSLGFKLWANRGFRTFPGARLACSLLKTRVLLRAVLRGARIGRVCGHHTHPPPPTYHAFFLSGLSRSACSFLPSPYQPPFPALQQQHFHDGSAVTLPKLHPAVAGCSLMLSSSPARSKWCTALASRAACVSSGSLLYTMTVSHE